MKITAKTTKQELKDFLGANVKAVQKKDKELFDRINYADKMAKTDDSKVTRKDLVDLAKEVQKVLGDKCVEPTATETVEVKAENSTKKLSGKKKTAEKTEAKAEETASEQKASGEEKPKKSLGKKAKEGDTASSKKTVQTRAMVLAEVFPDSFELDGTKYEVAKDIANMGQLHDALENDESLVFAMYWTKKHLKQFSYGVDTLKAPKEFPMDLDLATCIYVSDESVVAYAISAYTESCYMFTPNDIEETDGIRYAGGVEFQIYRVVE